MLVTVMDHEPLDFTILCKPQFDFASRSPIRQTRKKRERAREKARRKKNRLPSVVQLAAIKAVERRRSYYENRHAFKSHIHERSRSNERERQSLSAIDLYGRRLAEKKATSEKKNA